MKSPQRVVAEIEHVQSVNSPKMFTFCDNSFNVPKAHAEAICQELIARNLDIKWGADSLKPVGVTEEFCHLLRDAGCSYINLAVESGSEKMLVSMKRGYTADQIRQALSSLSKVDLPFGISLMIGAPGETPETIAETFELIDGFGIPLEIWVTIGICLWTPHQDILDEARQDGQLNNDQELFGGAYYISPELPKDYMFELIDTLGTKENYEVQVNKPYAS